jgi:hypothetical protein
VAAGLIFLTVAGATIFVIPIVSAGRDCESAFRKDHPEAAALRVTRSTWARTVDEHYAAAIVVQPLDLAQPPLTIVCSSTARSYALSQVETYTGDRLDKFVATSRSTLSPLSYIR